jgi:hypothetical protein
MKSVGLLLIDRIPRQMVRSAVNRVAGARSPWQCFPVLILILVIGSVAAGDAPATRREFAKVTQAVADYFRSLPDQQETDLVSQRQVRAALARVVAIGWQVPEQDKIANRALADNSFIVRELSTPEGRRFMRKLASHPGTYARLDRLSTLQNGQDTIHSLIQKKQGEDLITYLATTSGGKNLGRMMAGTKGGVDLNKPTDRIYTAEDLLIALKQAYDAPP